jgi:hypothetical protein
MYHEYKHQTSDNTFFNDKQTALIFSSKTLNDLLDDIVNVQTSSNENEFTSYRRQNMFL